jgi:hypothetical protein
LRSKGKKDEREKRLLLYPRREKRQKLGENKKRGRLCLWGNPGNARGHGDDAEVEFHGQADQGEVCSPFGLQVSIVKALQEHKSDEEREDEVEDGRRLMLETVIEGPVGHQGVEEIILDVPPVV